MARLVDSHVHLDRYPDEEVVGMVSRGAAAGVHRLLTIGVDLATSQAALELARRHPNILAAVGIHPTRLHLLESPPRPDPPPSVRMGGPRARAMNCAPTGPDAVGAQFIAPTNPAPTSTAPGSTAPTSTAPTSTAPGSTSHRLTSPAGPGGLFAQFLASLDQEPAAIGEVGLDEKAPDPEGQRRFLAACLDLAADHDLPLVLHVVGAPAVHAAALALVRRHPAVRTVAHYFVGGPDLARQYVEAGGWISVGRPVTRPTETAVRAAIPTIPLGRLLLETDTYPLPGRTTEPADVATVCAAVAELTGRTYEEIAAATTGNFASFIGS